MDYSKTLVDISMTDEEVVRDFTTLHPLFAEWVGTRLDKINLTTVQIIRYVVACYDKESPVVDAYKKRWMVKKRESAIVAGFPQDSDGKFIGGSDEVLFCQDNVFNKIVLRYLYLLHDRLYQTYVIYNEMYLHQSEELMRFDFQQPAHAKAAKENLETIGKDIEELEFKIFSGEETRKLKDLLYEDASNSLNELRPERIAVRLEEGKSAVDYNPYNGYVAEGMKFLGDE
jgi:hypothetical protein